MHLISYLLLLDNSSKCSKVNMLFSPFALHPHKTEQSYEFFSRIISVCTPFGNKEHIPSALDLRCSLIFMLSVCLFWISFVKNYSLCKQGNEREYAFSFLLGTQQIFTEIKFQCDPMPQRTKMHVERHANN